MNKWWYLGLAALVICVAVGVALWRYFSQPPQPQHVGQSWLEQRTLELADKAEKGHVFTDTEFNDLVKIATEASILYRGRALFALWFTKRPDQKPRALQIMIDTLRTTPELRADAINGIAYLGSEAHIELIKPYLSDPDPDVRLMTVNAIARLGGNKYRAVLEPFLQDPSEEVRERVQYILNIWNQKPR